MRIPGPLMLGFLALAVPGLLLTLPAACATDPTPTAASADDPAPTGPLPDDSLYQLDMDLLDQDGQTAELGRYRGHPTIITMFYASCPAACPMLISDIKAIESSLDATVRDDLRVVMVSFDPATDDPATLTALAEQRSIDTHRWTLASAPDDQVRSLAAVLGISYRRLDSGHYNHSAVITLLDAEGRPQQRIEGLGQANDSFIAALSN